MQANHTILSLLLLLISVTGAWAQEGPAANQIFYTTTDGQMIDINFKHLRAEDLKSHTYENGIGVITYQFPIDGIENEFKNETLQTICFGNALEYIGIAAFEECTNLKEVNLGGAVETIENSAFSHCSNLESVYNGRSVKNIKSTAFDSCIKLKNIEIGESLETIDNYAFLNCISLKEIILGESIRSIKDYAFEKCPIQVFVCKAPTPPAVDRNSFKDCGEFTKFVPYAHRGAYQNDATWGKWDIMPYGELLDESVFAISTSISPLLSVAKESGANPDIQTYMDKICTTTDSNELQSATQDCIKAIGETMWSTAYTPPTGTGMRMKVTKKDGNVYEFKTQEVKNVDYYRANQ